MLSKLLTTSLLMLSTSSTVQAQQFILLQQLGLIQDQTSAQNPSLSDLLMNNEELKTNDALLDKLLISPRKGVHGLLYDEVLALVSQMLTEFPDLLTKESIGKTYEGRDIWMLKLDGTQWLQNQGIESYANKKALLMTGAHHCRELVSVQMGLYTLLDILQGLLHNKPEYIDLIKRSQIFSIPIVNVDGSNKIMEEYNRTGQLILKRKNMDRSNEVAG